MTSKNEYGKIKVVISYSYDAWGNFTTQYHNNGLTSTARYNPFTYRGYYYDADLGLYYLNSRYYDPDIGRFISPDTTDILTTTPTGLTDKNLYAYCDNNPITRADNGGEFWHILVGAAVSIASQYICDVATNLLEGRTLLESLTPTSSWVDYGAAAVSGALAASGIGAVASIVGNAALSGTAYLMNCSINDEPTESVDFISATISGAISGAVGGKGANGKELRGVVRRSKEVIKSSVSQSKIAKYTLKIKGAKLEAIDSILRTVVGSISSNLFNGASNFLLN